MRRTHFERFTLVAFRIRVIGIRWGFKERIRDARVRQLRNRLQKYAARSLA